MDAEISMLVLHYTGMRSGREALERMCDRTAKVSAHYMVEEDGAIFQLVDEVDRAWHAGVSHWRGRDGLNDVSIGIEIVNPGHEFGYRPFPEQQMASLLLLCQDIVQRHALLPRDVVGHSDIAPNRKEDPGELFDWPALAAAGIGVWPDISLPETPQLLLKKGDQGIDVQYMQQRLQRYGYGLDSHGMYDEATTQVVTAFQRHFVPHHLTGHWNDVCDIQLDALLQMVEVDT